MNEREFFLKTDRIGFSKWEKDDIALAEILWGNPQVTRYICASGIFTKSDISNRLDMEIHNNEKYGVQYWPLFALATNELIGCCGLRPHKKNEYEIGFHLRPEYWNQGYTKEAALAVIQYAFKILKAEKLFAGHNPKNIISRNLLMKLGFAYIGDEYYEPTHLFHPSYELINLEKETQATILRIQQMEEYMDKVLNALSTCPDSIHELEEIKEMIAILTDYYNNGQWLKDYDRDSNGELPPDLKRGVLSQDALYNLLCDAKEFLSNDEFNRTICLKS